MNLITESKGLEMVRAVELVLPRLEMIVGQAPLELKEVLHKVKHGLYEVQKAMPPHGQSKDDSSGPMQREHNPSLSRDRDLSKVVPHLYQIALIKEELSKKYGGEK